jgi:UDP-N-acetylmuramoyl-tripeptide--D-alanyl-D-alanine ligase
VNEVQRVEPNDGLPTNCLPTDGESTSGAVNSGPAKPMAKSVAAIATVPEPATPTANRAHFDLGELVDAVNGSLLGGIATDEIEGISTDTRAIGPGSLFVALRGERFDGHQFLERAHEQGAVAAVVEHEEQVPKGQAPEGLALICVDDTTIAYGDIARAHRQKFDIPVIGVTGSYGKTTTRALVMAALSPLTKQAARSSVLSSAGNFNNEIGVPQTLLQLCEGHVAAIVEMGMRGAGQIDYLAKVALPTVGLITNVGPQHIEFFDEFEGVVRAKGELLQNLPADGLAVVPENKEYGALLASQANCRVVTFGDAEGSDYRVTTYSTRADGNVSFELTYGEGKTQHVKLPLPGHHNALNAAAALAVAYELGVDMAEAAAALARVEVPGARLRIVQVGGITIIDDSYNAGPDSMRAALQTLHSLPATGRRIAVLGAMRELGKWTEEEHRKLGMLCRDLDDVYGVAEETRVLLEAAGRDATHWFATASEAAPVIVETLRDGDVVLVKGSRSIGLEAVVEKAVSAHHA